MSINIFNDFINENVAPYSSENIGEKNVHFIFLGMNRYSLGSGGYTVFGFRN